MEIIKKIKVLKRNVLIEITEDYRTYFHEDFWMYSNEIDFRKIPQEILMVPLLLNIAPIIWACDLKVTIPRIDTTVRHSLSRLKQAFKKQYPEINWSGSINSKGVESKIPSQTSKDEVVLLFSGGIDSLNLSQDYLDKQQHLLTIRGSDIKLSDDKLYKTIKLDLQNYAKSINANSIFIESNFKNFINYEFLTRNFLSIANWWGEIQHGIGLASFLVIPACLHGVKIALMASDYSGEEMINMRWASTMLIMSSLRLPLCDFSHEGYDLSRQDKIKKISDKFRKKEKITIVRTCFSAQSNINCGRCNKCMLTMMGFIAAGTDYRYFGFSEPKNEFIRNAKKLFSINRFFNLPLWIEIQKQIVSRKEYVSLGLDDELIDILMWLQTIDLDKKYRRSHRLFKFYRLFLYLIRKIPYSYILIKKIKPK